MSAIEFSRIAANRINAMCAQTLSEPCSRQRQQFQVPQTTTTGTVTVIETQQNIFDVQLECSDPEIMQQPHIASMIGSFLPGTTMTTQQGKDELLATYNNVPRWPYIEWAEALKIYLAQKSADKEFVFCTKATRMSQDDNAVDVQFRLEKLMGEAGTVGEIVVYTRELRWTVEASIAAVKFVLGDSYHVTTVPSASNWVRVVCLPK